MEHAVEPNRLAGLDPERHDVLDLEVDRVPDTDAVTQPVVHDLDRRALDTQDLPDHGSEAGHGASELAAEDGCELVRLLVRGPFVDEHAEAPVALGHDLGGIRDRGELQAADIRAVDLPCANVEDECDATEVVRRAVVEREVARAT